MSSTRVEEKERVGIPLDDKMLTRLQPEEAQLLVSPPTMTPGNRVRENVLSFEALASGIQVTQLFEKKKLTSNMCDSQEEVQKFDLTVRELSLLCARNTGFSRSFAESQVMAAIRQGTIIGPVLKVQIVKILDGYEQ